MIGMSFVKDCVLDAMEVQQLFLDAVQSGTMEGFYKLISNFQTQSEPAYCGLASLSMVLNALAIDPGRKWKGPWRWFDESMLDCCESLEVVKVNGISFGKLVCLAQCSGAEVEAFRTSHSSIDEFRKYVILCSRSDDCHVITSYHRGTFKQTGTGHFSPIGGYHAGKDLALILDVARFKYPPHWVPLTLLWEAMDRVDESTGQHRGFMLISRPHREPGLLYTLSCKDNSWVSTAEYLMVDVPRLLESTNVNDVRRVISVIFMSLPSDFSEFIKWVAEVRRSEDGGQQLSNDEKQRLCVKEEILRQVQETGLYKHVQEFMSSVNSCCMNKKYTCWQDSLPEIAARVCCQGAELMAGRSVSSTGFCCSQTSVNNLKAVGDEPITVVSGKVVNGGIEQGIDVLVPRSPSKVTNCCGSKPSDSTGMHPAGSDVLTALLLALPEETWSGIRDDMLLKEIRSLVSIENFPTLLQEEVLHLRRQLHILKKCQGNNLEEDLGLCPNP
uniref:glutathione gamma-glutamylcysteinyltransferase n=1 Tax=Kalanchoe fedtschenkoi TaxID=63787 RepID=A0A7N0UBE1_KALFE